MKMLIGAIKPSKGDGFIKGQKIGSIEARRLIGFAPESPSFYNDMNAFDYLVYMARLGGSGYKEACQRAGKLLQMFELDKFKDKNVHKFSSGMKKKMGLAQAIIHDPEILILDEPTANLDPTARIQIVDIINQLVKEKNYTVLISSHILTELEQLADHVILINKGAIVLQGDIHEIKKEFNRGRFVLKTSNNARTKEALNAYPSVLRMNENDNGELYLISDDVPALKKAIISILNHEDLTLDHFSEEEITLENIYKSILSQGGAY